MAGNRSDIIDLSESYTLADHRGISNTVIELDSDDSYSWHDTGIIEVDNSIVELPSPIPLPTNTIQATTSKNRKSSYNQLKYIYENKKVAKNNVNNHKDTSNNQFGDCPICLDKLGVNPLASTKCGHVYCMKCLKIYLSKDSRCPTCRQVLKGKAAYHPLYLNN